MSRNELRRYNELKRMLWEAYRIRDRDIRIQSVGALQTALANLMGD